jgi:nucleoside-diphosphate-sugar epimerase
VLLSGRNEAEAEKAERVVMAIRPGVDDCAVRVLRAELRRGRVARRGARGTVSLPVDQVQEPFVDADDIADVAVAALTDDRHVGQLYELTGPRLLSFRDAWRRSARPRAATSRSCRCRSRTTPRCSRNTVCRKTSSGC